MAAEANTNAIIPVSCEESCSGETTKQSDAVAASAAWRSHTSFRLMRSLVMLGTAQGAGSLRCARDDNVNIFNTFVLAVSIFQILSLPGRRGLSDFRRF